MGEASSSGFNSRFSEVEVMAKQRKIAVMLELVTACVADIPDGKGEKNPKYGYDARQRVALRLLALWLDIEWSKVVCTITTFHFSYLNRLVLTPEATPKKPKLNKNHLNANKM